MPYLPDAGASCGQGFVNSPGALDGVTIVGGHEYAETITDQNPAGGWTDASGAENGDKCAWISSGQGASQNITLGTGKFAVQSTWANDGNGGQGACEVSHPIR
jgi:serine protease